MYSELMNSNATAKPNPKRLRLLMHIAVKPHGFQAPVGPLCAVPASHSQGPGCHEGHTLLAASPLPLCLCVHFRLLEILGGF